MKSFHFETIEALNNVVAQLPEAARRPESGRSAAQAEDGSGWIMYVPDEFIGDVEAADPNKVQEERRPVAKSLVMERLKAAGKLDAALAGLLARADLFGRWFAPDRGFVNSSDPDTIAFLTALGVDPVLMLAPPDAPEA